MVHENTTSNATAKCVQCGCTDNRACVVGGVPCHWLRVDYDRGEGVCSVCPEALHDWDSKMPRL